MNGVLMDNAGDNLSESFCADEGIEILTTAVYNRELNWKAERKNRTLVELIRAMLAESGSKNYWKEAMKMPHFGETVHQQSQIGEQCLQ